MSNNPQLQNAAFTGIISGVEKRWITSSVSGSYQALVSTANLIASLIDASIVTYSVTFSDIHLMKCMCEGIFASRDIIGSGSVNIHESIVQVWSQLRAKFSATNNLNSDQFLNRSIIAGLTLSEALDNVPTFIPNDCPEIQNGYYWDSTLYLDLGLTTFRWLNQTPRIAFEFDQVQTTVALQPGQVTNLGNTQWVYRGSLDPNPTTTSQPTNNHAAGWTGSTYVALWIKFPAGVTGTNTTFRQSGGSGQRRILTTRSAADIRLGISNDGNGLFTYVWNQAADTNWHFIEHTFNASAAAALRGELCVDRVTITPSVSPAVGAALFNPLRSMQVNNAVGVANPDTAHVGMAYYGNGNPSVTHRNLLYRYKSPVLIA